MATSTVPGIAKGIYEEEESIYNLKEKSEEEKLFEVNESIRSLLEGLEIKENALDSLKIISSKENEICVSYEKSKVNIEEIINLIKNT